ncbi:MAG: FAD:protein FMN transferase [Sulfuriferula sp.]
MNIPNNPELLERRRLLKAAAGLALVSGIAALGGWVVVNRDRNLIEVRRERSIMATSVSVTCLAADVEGAGQAIEAALARMAAAAAVLTRFEPDSPLARLNHAGQLADPPSELHTVLGRALEIARYSDGDFDVSVLPVLDYFFELRQPVTLSEANRHAIALRERLVGFRHVDLGASEIRLTQPGMAITLDGIAKGYVVDQGIAALREAGIEYGLIDAGGEVRAMAGTDPKRFWNVGILDPQRPGRVAAVVRLRNAALSTSGNYEVFFSTDRRLFHIINPHTGYSPDRYSSVTVMAEESMEADAMSVAAFSMELPRLKEIMAARGHQWLVFSWDGAQRWRSAELPLVSGQASVEKIAT